MCLSSRENFTSLMHGMSSLNCCMFGCRSVIRELEQVETMHTIQTLGEFVIH